MKLPRSLFKELADVTLLLTTKGNREGEELLSYCLGDPDETVVYNVDEEEYRFIRKTGNAVFLVSVSYKGAEVLRIEKVSKGPKYIQMGVFTEAGDLLGRIWKSGMDYIVEDDDGEKLFHISCPGRSLQLMYFPMLPKYVIRVADQEPLAYMGRRFMMEPLENTRSTPIHRWCVRYLVTPMSLKEKVLILAAVLVVDYNESAVHYISSGIDCVCL